MEKRKQKAYVMWPVWPFCNSYIVVYISLRHRVLILVMLGHGCAMSFIHNIEGVICAVKNIGGAIGMIPQKKTVFKKGGY